MPETGAWLAVDKSALLQSLGAQNSHRDNVWIGMQCIILKGVTIGDGAVIAAGSVVAGDIPANCMAVGVPARVVRDLALT